MDFLNWTTVLECVVEAGNDGAFVHHDALEAQPIGVPLRRFDSACSWGLLSLPAKISWCVVTHENSPGDVEYSVRVARCARP